MADEIAIVPGLELGGPRAELGRLHRLHQGVYAVGHRILTRNAHVEAAGRLVECDCLWRAERLVVELDGHATHGRRSSFESDRTPSKASHTMRPHSSMSDSVGARRSRSSS